MAVAFRARLTLTKSTENVCNSPDTKAYRGVETYGQRPKTENEQKFWELQSSSKAVETNQFLSISRASWAKKPKITTRSPNEC